MRNIQLLIVFAIIIILENSYAQNTPMPSTETGINRTEYDVQNKEYTFLLDDEPLYKYKIGVNGNCYQNGATFYGITARTQSGQWFRPSNVGGVCAELGGTERKPWSDEITYKLIKHIPPPILPKNNKPDETVNITWRMQINDNDYIDYKYTLMVSGKSLIIGVNVLNNSIKATGFEFDRCEGAENPIIVRVPYLNLFNLLYTSGSYTSLFVDWEQTNASTIYPLDIEEYYSVPDSLTSARFAQHVRYYKKTDYKRNPLNERIYLTVSNDIDKVLPNLPGPIAPLKNQAQSKTVLSYGPPYPWLIYPSNGYNYKYLDSLNERGVNDLNVIIKQYQYYGFDRRLPDVLGPNNEPDPFWRFYCDRYDAGGKGGKQALLDVGQHIKDLNYGFALHEQYVDYYSNSPSYNEKNNVKKSPTDDGVYTTGWTDCARLTAFILKPTLSKKFLDIWSYKLNNFRPTWSYLDVHSGANPSDFVDYDCQTVGAGKFTTVLNNYRTLPNSLKSYYGNNAVIQGEGGKGLMLYAGYFDDLEARLLTADYTVYGYYAPLFVDFAINKIKPKSALHGVGHCGGFFAPCITSGCENIHLNLSTEELYTYIATELAYGNPGLITKGAVYDHTIEQAVLEQIHVLPLAKAIIGATVQSILYGDEGMTASEYIAAHPDFANIDNEADFMGKVKVTYSNGIIVCVNRHPSYEWLETVGSPNKYFSYHAYNSNQELVVYDGITSFNRFKLPPQNGWVVYYPNRTYLKENSATDSVLFKTKPQFTYTLKNNYPNPFNPTTRISYSIKEDGLVSIKVFDILGREVADIVNEEKLAGNYEIEFNGSNLASGVYVYRIQSGNFTDNKKMVLTK